MPTTSENNKRIAKNTLMLYIRMAVVMCVSIYTSRVYLYQLGITDYGIYNVVGGFIGMFTSLNSSLSASTQRFITYTLGKGEHEKLKDVFAAAMNIHIILGLFIVLLLETVGLWFLNNKLVIPADRMVAANWVYQFVIISTFLGMLQVPFNGLINAHEDMGTFAWLSIFDVSFKLGIAFALSVAPFDKLIFFGLLFLIVYIIMTSIYRAYCYRHYEECKYRIFWNQELYKSMSVFAGWNIFGGLAWMLKDQGANVLLNLFFGPAINAARAVALQVSTAVTGFVGSFQTATYPQITKYYASGDLEDMHRLVNRSLRMSFLLVFFLAFPIMLNIDFILSIWLKKVPDMSDIFLILVLIDSLFQCILGAPISTMISATGDIKKFQIYGSLNMAMIIPVSYLLLKFGASPTVVFYVIIVFNFFAGLIRLYYAHKQVQYSYKTFVNQVVSPVIKILIVTLPVPILLKLYVLNQNNWMCFLILCIIILFIMIPSFLFLGFEKNERNVLFSTLKHKIHII
jgi:O-antigen/teichoic acid export membrane protein